MNRKPLEKRYSSKYLLYKDIDTINYIDTYHNEIDLHCFPEPYLVNQLINLLKPNISQYSGSNYYATDIRLFRTSMDINCGVNTNNKPHLDGSPMGHFKLIVYLDDVNIENGPFCIVENSNDIPIVGKKGTIILFEHQQQLHRSLPITSGSRSVMMIEFLRLPFKPRAKTLNATRPINAMRLISPFFIT